MSKTFLVFGLACGVLGYSIGFLEGVVWEPVVADQVEVVTHEG
jgi:hypothetical protein